MPRKKIKDKRSKIKGKKTVWIVVAFACILAFFVFSLFKSNLSVFRPCANSISCIKDLSGNYEETSEKGVFLGRELATPIYIANDINTPSVLGESTNADKHIYVDLTNQRLYAYEGGKVLYNFPVSTGKWNHTPTGDFRIWIKLLYTRMSGGSGADYYNLPNVPYTMFYYNSQVPKADGYSIHGAYWHNNFGHPMSHGCVNMRPEDAAYIYNWADPATKGNTTYASDTNPGTIITVYGETPGQ